MLYSNISLQYFAAILRWTLANVQRLSTKAVQKTRSSLIIKNGFKKGLERFCEQRSTSCWTALNSFKRTLFETRSQILKFTPIKNPWTGFQRLKEARMGQTRQKRLTNCKKEKSEKDRFEKRKQENNLEDKYLFWMGTNFFPFLFKQNLTCAHV